MRSVAEAAECKDCSWSDDQPGCRGRAGRHHRDTGHRVVTEATTTYDRQASVEIPGQTNIYDILGGEAA